MENILLSVAVAGLVFIIFLLLLLKTVTSAETQRKEAVLGKIVQNSMSAPDAEENFDFKLLKDNLDAGDSFLSRLPLISSARHLLRKAGLWEKRAIYIIISLMLFLVTALLLQKLGIFAVLAGIAVADFIPTRYLKYKIAKRSNQFLDLFPDAVDLIIRSVRSGHPINTAMRMITENMESPIRDEFKQVVDEVSYGRTLPEALRRMAARLELADVDFFAVVLSVQQETGGSLTEVLTNLSNIIRKRKQLRARIQAMTSEGRATSYILGAIPVVEFAALMYLTPSYLEPLFTTLAGNIMLGVAVSLVVASQCVIRYMINIEI